jgi:release factor glutamine methyltransferase
MNPQQGHGLRMNTDPSSRTRIKRRLWRAARRWQFRLFLRHRHNRLVLETVADKPLLILPQVLNPKLFRTGEFLVSALSGALIPPGSTVLDMGTGSGIGAIFAAQWATRVVGVDINPAAVRCARINVLLNGLENQVEIHQGDLFRPTAGQQFDVVLFNPPFLRGQPRNDLERALYSMDILERFAQDLGSHLTSGGHAVVVLSSDGDVAGCLGALEVEKYDVTLLAQQNLRSEILLAYRVSQRLG